MAESGLAASLIWREAPLLMLRLDRGHKVIEANAYAEQFTGEPLVGRCLDDVVVDFSHPEQHLDLASCLASTSPLRLNWPAAGGELTTLLFRFVAEEPGTVLALAWHDMREITSLQQQLLMINRELSHTARAALKDYRFEMDRESDVHRRILNAAGEGILGLDATGCHSFVNPAALQLLGYGSEELIGRPASLSWLCPPPHDAVEQEHSGDAITRTLTAGDTCTSRRGHFRCRDGHFVTVSFSSHPIVERRRIMGAVLTFADITERERTEALVRESEQRFRNLANSGSMLIWTAGLDKLCDWFNEPWLRFTGRSLAQEVGEGWIEGVHPDDLEGCIGTYVEAFDRREAFSMDYRLRHADGSYRWIRDDGTPRFDSRGEFLGYIGFCMDITERRVAAERIEHLAYYDPLTDLPNRRLMLDRLGQAVSSSPRRRQCGALLMIDLDNFKSLNDSQGHAAGDSLLVQAAARLRACVRQGDTVARSGGDEFVVILEGLDEINVAALHAEAAAVKIQRRLAEPFWLELKIGDHFRPVVHECTASIGITLFGDPPSSPEDLLQRADTALYQAKASGRNTLRFFDPAMQAAVTARMQLEGQLRRAVAEEQFVLHYQPQVNVLGQLIGAEALVRWRHPERGMVSPAEFIPVAEDTGLIVPLGLWVLETACRQLAAWAQQPRLAALTLAVNVSSRQLRQADFVARVLAAVARTGAPPGRLKLELTESLLLDKTEDVIAKMTALKAHQIGFALDDFGTGYSSLSYLRRLPLDDLKIDQSFVKDALTDPNAAAIARTVVALGLGLGLGVIAEGVETTAQRHFLAALGCNFYQGYLFSRPVAAAEFEAWGISNASATSSAMSRDTTEPSGRTAPSPSPTITAQ